MSKFHEQKTSLLWPIETVQFYFMPDSWFSQEPWHTKYNPWQLILANSNHCRQFFLASCLKEARLSYIFDLIMYRDSLSLDPNLELLGKLSLCKLTYYFRKHRRAIWWHISITLFRFFSIPLLQPSFKLKGILFNM